MLNFQHKLLDLVFVSNSDKVTLSESTVPLLPIDLYHKPVELRIDVSVIRNLKIASNQFYNFKKANFLEINKFFSTVDWTLMYTRCNDEVNTCVDFLYDKLWFAIRTFVPLIKKKQTNQPPWFNKQVRNLKNKKNKAYKKYIASKTSSDYRAYAKLRRKLLRSTKVNYRKYIIDMQNNLATDPKKFWTYVNSKKKTHGFPSSMSYNNVQCSSPKDICENFACFFESVYVSDSSQVPSVSLFNNNINISTLCLSYECILEALLNLDESKGSGPDNIPPVLLKICARTLVVPLQNIYNASLKFGTFPNRWKPSFIIPIFKSGSRSNIENYRGIAILSAFGKLFESLVTNFLTSQFSNYISPNQHGFMKGRSTCTNLLEFVNFTTGVIEDGDQVDVIYTDICKAFDRLLHSVLLKKLNSIGVHSAMLAWIQSYLGDREQFVKVSGWISRPISVTSGVPQGSHLGPLLFILFMNDVTDAIIYSKCLMFADDLKIFCRVKSILDATNLQRDLDTLSSWCQSNCLTLNINKCKTFSFYRTTFPLFFNYEIQNTPLVRVQDIKDLGIIFDKTLSFNLHIDFIVSKAYSMLGFMMRICSDFNDVSVFYSLYFAHVRAHLEYAAVIWSPNYSVHICRIESVQKKFYSYLFRKFGYYNVIKFAPYEFKCSVLKIEQLSDRRKNARILFVFDLLTGRIDSTKILSLIDINVPVRRLRNNTFIRIPNHRTNYALFEPVLSMSSLFNEVYYLFDFGQSRLAFKNSIRSIQPLNETEE